MTRFPAGTGTRGLLRLLKKIALVFLVVLVVALAAFGIPVPVLFRGQHRPSLRNEHVASEVMRRQAAA
jgi:hypothetical protein